MRAQNPRGNPRNDTTAERVREILDCDPERGELRWRYGAQGRFAGDLAGCLRKDGYRVIRIDGVLYLSHRIIWLWVTGKWPPALLDHRDRDPSDNRWGAFRPATIAQNQQNMGTRRFAQSGFKGAYLDKRRGHWRSSIHVNGKDIYLGRFPTAESAAAAYREACVEYHGDFAVPSYTLP